MAMEAVGENVSELVLLAERMTHRTMETAVWLYNTSPTGICRKMADTCTRGAELGGEGEER